MNSITVIRLSSAVTLVSISALGQGTFQNLDFESANLSPVPPNEGPFFVTVASGLPDWNAYVGSTQQTQLLQNNYTLGQASVDILGPNYPAASSLSSPFLIPGVIDGNYSVLLQAGGDPQTGLTTGVSIAQTGTVPLGSESIQFKAWETGFTEFTVSLGGNILTPVALGNGANYTLFGASIPPSLVGQSAQLQFTADFVTPGVSWLGLDDISFSPQAVPEPSPFVLSGIGGLLFALYRRFASKRK
jgi:hypothetical protein